MPQTRCNCTEDRKKYNISCLFWKAQYIICKWTGVASTSGLLNFIVSVWILTVSKRSMKGNNDSGKLHPQAGLLWPCHKTSSSYQSCSGSTRTTYNTCISVQRFPQNPHFIICKLSSLRILRQTNTITCLSSLVKLLICIPENSLKY